KIKQWQRDRNSERVSPRLVALSFGGRAMTRQILIVEDNADDSFLMSQIVGNLMDIKCLAVRDGSLALKAATGQDYNLVLLYLNLPDALGWDIAAALRKLPSYRHIPIIATSAYDSASSSKNSQGAGCDAFMAKPIDIDKLIALINKCLRET